MYIMHVSPVILEGQYARLEPLQMSHAPQLYNVSQFPTIWRYMSIRYPETVADIENWIATALREQEQGVSLPFTIFDRAQQQAVGSTRYLNIVPKDRGLEIGWTWLTPSAQRTRINTECKYLLLKHAFETLGAIRVQLKTDSRNVQSQRAIERIGGVKEGILRNAVIMPDGYYRQSVYYSIIDSEWPDVKQHLETMLQ